MLLILPGCSSYNSRVEGELAGLKPLKDAVSRPAVVYVASSRLPWGERIGSKNKYEKFHKARERNRRWIGSRKQAYAKQNIIPACSLEEFARYCSVYGNNADYYLLEQHLAQTSDGTLLDQVMSGFALCSVLILPGRNSEGFHAQWNLYRFDAESGLAACAKPIEYDVRNTEWFSCYSPMGLFFPGGSKPFDYMKDLHPEIAPKCFEHLLSEAQRRRRPSGATAFGDESAKVLNSLSARIFRKYYDANKAYVASARSMLRVNGTNVLVLEPGTHNLRVTHSSFTDGGSQVYTVTTFEETTLQSNLKAGCVYLVDCDNCVSQVRLFELGPMTQITPVLYAYLMEN